jgi:hypothetical protein
VFKPSRRAVAIAVSFALGLSVVGPAAHAGLLGGSDDSDSMALEGIGLPVGGDLLGGDLLGGVLGGGLLGGDLLGGVLGGGLLGGDLLGGGLPLVGPVLDGVLGGGALGGDLLGGGLPLVGGVLGEDGVLGGEMLDVVTDTTLSCDAAIPQVLRTFIGEAADAVCEPFSYGLLGLLGSL